MRSLDEREQIEKSNEQIRRAQQAKEALSNPLVKEYFIIARAALFERFGKTKDDQVDEREHIYLELQQLERFESNFEKTITGGKVAENWLQELARRTKNAIKR